jgi:ligand-binding sensor domain-containing protein
VSIFAELVRENLRISKVQGDNYSDRLKLLQFYLFKIILFSSVLLKFVSGQIAYPDFEHISIEHGLSQSTITCIMQDKKGFIWIGTRDGLNKYDGYNFKVFRNDPNDNTSISDNSVISIAEDEYSDIWIGTGSGFINRFDSKTNKFSSYRLIKDPIFPEITIQMKEIPPCYSFFDNNSITSLCPDKDGNLWAGTWGKGLFKFDIRKRKFTGHLFSMDDDNSLSSDYILSIKQDDKGFFWIGTYGGGLDKMIMKGNSKSKSSSFTFVTYSFNNHYQNCISNNRVTSICFDKDEKNTLWIGTFGGGINKLKFYDNPDSIYFSLPDDKLINSDKITQICADEAGLLWVGTFGSGLIKFDMKKKESVIFKNNPYDDNSINDNDVIALALDRTGLIWSGTLSGYGINKLNQEKIKFTHYKVNPSVKNSLSDNVILTFAEDKNENVWIGTYKGGLNKFDRKKKAFSNYMNIPEDKYSLNSNYVTSVCADNNSNLWIGTFNNGLNFLNNKTNKFTHFLFEKNNKNSISDNRITSIIIDKSGIIWIGTFGGGLNKGVKNINGIISFTNYKRNELYPGTLPDNRIERVFEDSDGILWIATYNGYLCRFEKQAEEFINYKIIQNESNKISETRILSICEDGSGNLWLGTYGIGLISFDKKNNGFTVHNNIPNINSKIMYGILEDDENNLWISSDKGLIKYDMKTNSVTNFDLNDGLQSMQFNSGAAFKTSNGEMFFGGINGFNCFFPKNITTNSYVPKVIITSARTSAGELLPPGNSIQLSHYDNSIIFEFSALDFTNPAQNQFAYRLAGFDSTWHYLTSGQHSAAYVNLPSGKYLFQLKGSNNSGTWNKNEVQLSVIISQPFWKTWWFIFIIVFSIGGLIVYSIVNRIYRYLAIEKLKSKLSADLHDTVGSGLTEISLLAEIAAREIGEDKKVIKEKLKLMGEKAGILINDMSDIIWMVNPRHDTLFDLILRLKDINSPICESLGIAFKIQNLELLQNLKISMEQRQNIYLIFREAINNCLKHSESKNIILDAEIDNRNIELTLTDDGKGFNKNNPFSGNGLKNMKLRAGTIKGELEISSAIGHGTKIILSAKIK